MQLDARKVQAAADIIADSAIEFLANKHGCTPQDIRTEIEDGALRTREQFDALVRAAIAEAQRLAADGRISFEVTQGAKPVKFADIAVDGEFDFNGGHYVKTSENMSRPWGSIGPLLYLMPHEVVEVK